MKYTEEDWRLNREHMRRAAGFQYPFISKTALLGSNLDLMPPHTSPSAARLIWNAVFAFRCLTMPAPAVPTSEQNRGRSISVQSRRATDIHPIDRCRRFPEERPSIRHENSSSINRDTSAAVCIARAKSARSHIQHFTSRHIHAIQPFCGGMSRGYRLLCCDNASGNIAGSNQTVSMRNRCCTRAATT